MNKRAPTALIADDEPLLRQALSRMLAATWPELVIVAEARNGREAIDRFEEHHPDVCFLDVQMPGKTGVDAAQHIGRRAHMVFVTAYDKYAVQAFAHGVLDYLVKPVEVARLAGGSHALTTTRVSGPPPGDVTAWTSNGVSGRGGGPPMFLPVRSKTPLWQ